MHGATHFAPNYENFKEIFSKNHRMISSLKQVRCEAIEKLHRVRATGDTKLFSFYYNKHSVTRASTET